MQNETNSTPKLTTQATIPLIIAFCCFSFFSLNARANTVAPAPHTPPLTLFTHTPSHNEVITFQLQKGSLESNIKRLLSQHSATRMLLWEVSKQHQVIIDATVQAPSVYELIDKIISPYNSPAQIKADVYTANGVARFYYLPDRSSYQQLSP